MLVAAINLGPEAPVLGLWIAGLAIVTVVAFLAVRFLPPVRGGPRLRGNHRLWIGVFLWVATFLLWTCATGKGGPDLRSGMTGATRAGLLRYLTIRSYRPVAGASWTHDISHHPVPLVATLALNGAVLMTVARGPGMETPRLIPRRCPPEPPSAMPRFGIA